MSFEDIKGFEEQVALKNVRRVAKGDLVLYNYTDQCTYEKAWDTKYTRNARGIIYNQKTGELVAKPFPKFFNLGEMPETMLINLPDCEYEVCEKLDGSLGIIYWHDNQWNMATRGSFDSEQAIKGLEILKKYSANEFSPVITYLVEIIYPSNKIVVNYGQEEKLVLLGAYGKDFEFTRAELEIWASLSGMPISKVYNHTIKEMIELQKTIPKDEEGFVVRYENGLRVKIKGAEYLKIHKMIANMSPLSFWESMDYGIVDEKYLSQLPEEFRSTFEPMVDSLEKQYGIVYFEIEADCSCLPVDPKDHKAVGLFVQNPYCNLKHPKAVFPFILKKYEALDKYIMKTIRPDGNILK